jgi:hypothetical protein
MENDIDLSLLSGFPLKDGTNKDPISEIKCDEDEFPWYDIPKEDLTCNNCPDKATCHYAFDAYNTNGDCLTSK